MASLIIVFQPRDMQLNLTNIYPSVKLDTDAVTDH